MERKGRQSLEKSWGEELAQISVPKDTGGGLNSKAADYVSQKTINSKKYFHFS